MIRALLTPLACLALVAAAAPGCGPACSPSERTFTGGATTSDGQTLYYESSPPGGPFLPYEGSTLLHLKHKFGTRPALVQVYLAFSERPEVVGGGGSSTAAGNQAVYLKQDAEEIAVKNDSCANYFIRVVATGPAPSAADASVDAAPDAAAD